MATSWHSYASYLIDIPQEQQRRRNKIDDLAQITPPTGKEAYPASREFIRIDSTYYVGYMYEGFYRKEIAADYLGYQLAIAPLKKAMSLMEKDYDAYLRARTADGLEMFIFYNQQLTYQRLADALSECYMNTEQNQECFDLATHVQQYNLQTSYYYMAFIRKSWLVHRSRFYTSAKYRFLKNSVGQNEAQAQLYLDSAVMKIKNDAKFNYQMMPSLEQLNLTTVAHYRAILYSYSLQIDSANKYYDIMRNSGSYSHNNYGNFLAVTGDFAEASDQYNTAKMYGQDKSLREYEYFQSILDINAGQTAGSISKLKDLIKEVGSTPGFGWYNIALARAESYNGLLTESDLHSAKAEKFKELHIGTTLGQSQYDFSLNLVKYINTKRSLAWLKLQHKNWWYNPWWWPKLWGLKWDLYTARYLLITQFASNPERDAVIYKLFATESTVSWDEIAELVNELSPKFFRKKFLQERELAKDRPLVKKYFSYLLAQIDIDQGDYNEANIKLQSVLHEDELDPVHEQLLIARCSLSLAHIAYKQGQDAVGQDYLQKVYRFFPQLIPFQKHPLALTLKWVGKKNSKVDNLLSDADISWGKSGNNIPVISIQQRQNSKDFVFDIKANDANGSIFPTITIAEHDEKIAQQKVLQAIFNIGEVKTSDALQ